MVAIRRIPRFLAVCVSWFQVLLASFMAQIWHRRPRLPRLRCAVTAVKFATWRCDAGERELMHPGAGDSEGVATYRPRGTGGMDALLSATVAFENGCVYARSQEFDERWLPVFPVDDVQWDGQRLTALGASYDIGAPIELPGGAVREPTSPYPVPDEFEIPEPCNADYIWLVN